MKDIRNTIIIFCNEMLSFIFLLKTKDDLKGNIEYKPKIYYI